MAGPYLQPRESQGSSQGHTRVSRKCQRVITGSYKGFQEVPEGRVCRDFITGSYKGFEEVPEGHHSFGQGVPDFHSEAVAVFKSGRSYLFPCCTLIYKSEEALKKK